MARNDQLVAPSLQINGISNLKDTDLDTAFKPPIQIVKGRD